MKIKTLQVSASEKGDFADIQVKTKSCDALTDGASGLETVLECAVWIVTWLSDLFSRFKCYVLLLSFVCDLSMFKRIKIEWYTWEPEQPNF